MKRVEKSFEFNGLKLEIKNNGSVFMSKDENKNLGVNQCETRVVAAKESSMGATNNELEKQLMTKWK